MLFRALPLRARVQATPPAEIPVALAAQRKIDLQSMRVGMSGHVGVKCVEEQSSGFQAAKSVSVPDVTEMAGKFNALNYTKQTLGKLPKLIHQ